ncbi:hypothetical protein [Mangrovicoccus ximenensis]|uniref:hypothetical protein n=1 Tax=Mangrovicoccus ximenensis TaxID=1911570 RepID=UPI0011AE9041|nr:hypothetical protein [Mangrovicoccus ximenensis]
MKKLALAIAVTGAMAAHMTHADPAAAPMVTQVPGLARAAYGGTPPPGTALADPGEWRAAPVISRHLALLCDLSELEVLHLGADLHRRAVFAARDGWAGRWLAP